MEVVGRVKAGERRTPGARGCLVGGGVAAGKEAGDVSFAVFVRGMDRLRKDIVLLQC